MQDIDVAAFHDNVTDVSVAETTKAVCPVFVLPLCGNMIIRLTDGY